MGCLNKIARGSKRLFHISDKLVAHNFSNFPIARADKFSVANMPRTLLLTALPAQNQVRAANLTDRGHLCQRIRNEVRPCSVKACGLRDHADDQLLCETLCDEPPDRVLLPRAATLDFISLGSKKSRNACLVPEYDSIQ
jgi:hypothetical protein